LQQDIPTPRKLALLKRQIERAPEASASDEAAVIIWRQSCIRVIEAAVGKQDPLSKRAAAVSFASVVNLPVPQSWARAQGTAAMTGILELAILEVELRATDTEPLPMHWIAPELWAAVGHLVELDRWEQVVSQAVIFFEDWVRRKTGLPKTVVGDKLMGAAFDAPGGVLALGGGQPPGEGQGWAQVARGHSLAVSNSSRHRIDQRDDAERYAMGVLGTITLLMTQVELEHPVTPVEPASLEVTIKSERFHPFKHKALIAEIEVAVRNNSDRQKDLTGMAMRSYDPSEGAMLADAEVANEVRRLKAPRARIAGTVDPDETVIGWFIHAFPHHPEGGKPGYEVFVEDELGHEYHIKSSPEPKRTYSA